MYQQQARLSFKKLVMSFEPMSLGEIELYANQLGIHGFRGVFMRQMLPQTPMGFECGILNLGNIDSSGTHWTCYVKDENKKFYFDSFGNAPPPLELIEYLGSNDLFYNDIAVQDYNDPPICGHLCLEVLRRNSNDEPWDDIIRAIRDDKYVWTWWWQRKIPVQ